MVAKLLLIGALAAAPSVSINILPRVMMRGATIRLTCRVMPHPDNRELLAGFTNWTETSRQLEGAEAPITYQFTWQHVPCDPGEGYCVVKRVNKQNRVTMPIEVRGCDLP